MHAVERRSPVRSQADQEGNFVCLPRGQIESGVQRGTWIEAGAEPAAQCFELDSGGVRNRAIAADELALVSRRGLHLARAVDEGATGCKIFVVRIASQNRAARSVEFSDHMQV